MNQVSQPALSGDQMYNLKNTAYRTTKLRNVVYPTNKGASYSPSSQIIFNLPIIANSYMMGETAYLKLEVQFTTAATYYVDNSASSLINQIQEYSADGTQLSTILDYNVLLAILNDLGYTGSDKVGIMSGTQGFEESLSTISGTATAIPGGSTGAVTAAQLSNTKTVRQGQTIVSDATTKVTFCIPLVTPLFALSEKMFPIWKLSGEPRIEITLADTLEPFVVNGAYTWTITDAQLVVDYLKIEDSSIIRSVTPDNVVIHSTAYRTFINSIATATASSFQSLPIPFRGSSAKGILVAQNNLTTNTANQYNVSSRINLVSSDLQLNIGGETYPNKGLKATTTCVSELTAELQKFFHSFSSMNAYNGCLPNSYLTACIANKQVALLSYQNGAVFGLDLESYEKKSNLILSGRDMTNSLTFLQFTSLGTTDSAVQVDTFVYHDILFLIDQNGSLSVRY